MEPLKTIDFNIHFANTLLKHKGTATLSLIQSLIDELRKKKEQWDKQIITLNERGDNLKQSALQSEEPFKKLLKDREQKAAEMEAEQANKILHLQETIGKLKKAVAQQSDDSKKVTETQIHQLSEQFVKSQENLAFIKEINKTTHETLVAKQSQFLKQVKEELNKIQDEINTAKDLIQKVYGTLFKLENLHHAVSKNPNTLFNDKIPHNLLMYASKDSNFRAVLNDFLCTALEQKDFSQVCEKVGKLMNDVYQKSKNISQIELFHIYFNMLKSVVAEGLSRLDKSTEIILVDPEMEKSIKQFRNDLTISEVLQIAKLKPEIQKKVLSMPIAVEYYIQLMRYNAKSDVQKKLQIQDSDWEALTYLTARWPVFFIKFGQGLNAFADPDMIRKFHHTIDDVKVMLKNQNSEQIFRKILFLREHSRETFHSGMKAPEYIELLYDSVAMTKTLRLRNAHHIEVLKVYDEIKDVHKNKFLKLFDGSDVAAMLLLAPFKNLPIEEQQNIYVRINPAYEKLENILPLFGLTNYEDLPPQIYKFLRTIYVDAADHLKQVENILEKIQIFEKNIQMSVVSSEKQVPLANAIYHSVIKCGEYTSAYKALENMVITKELSKMLSRKANQQKS